MPQRFFLLNLFFLALYINVAAQAPLQYTRLSAEDGLSNNSVQCVMQGKRGIMWIGTNGGLNRYDGSSFIQYNILSEPALTNGVVTAMMEDEKGYIWIGTDNGLNILNPSANTILHFVHQDSGPSSLPAGPIRAIQKMKDGRILIMSDTWLVKVTGLNSFSRISIDTSLQDADMVFVGVTERTSNQLWLSYLDKTTILVPVTTGSDTREHISAPVFSTNDYAKIYNDAASNTWSISCYGIGRYNKNTNHFDNWIKNNGADNGPNLHLHTCYCVDADGNIWQGSERSSLVRYDMAERKMTDYGWLIRAANATIVYCVYKDNNNNIWAGTDNGIIKISNRAAIFNNIPFILQGKELKNIRCRRIIADRNNTLYAATENYGLLKNMKTKNGGDTTIALSTFGAVPVSDLLTGKNTIRIKLNGHYDIGYIYDMYYDQKDIIWLAGFGISRYNTRTDSLEIFLTNGDARSWYESINQLSICFDGKLFWTAGEHNLFTFDPVTRHMEAFKDNKGNMPFTEIPCWSLVIKGDWIWAGSAKGLFKVNIHTREVVKQSIHPVLEHGINDISLDGDSSLWISTAGGGVIYYNEKTGQVKQYTNRDGLSNNTVCGLLRDENDDCWISTYAGLSYFNRQTNQFTNFYAKDGLNTDEFNRKAFSKLPDGTMIFGGLNGYMQFDPDKAFKRDEPVNILLTRFSKISRDGQTVETIFDIGDMKKVIIDPGDKFFSFYFTLSDMYDPAGNRYLYQLKGLDNEWHSIGNQHSISFNALEPGKYILRIKGTAGKGSASVNEISLDILVKQVFYRTAWFLILVVLSTAAIVYVIVRNRIDQVKRIQYLRTKIASDLHDDVGSSLVRITILADAVKREEIKENTSEQLGTIAGISRGAVSTMKDVIWSIDARNDTMGGMIRYMQEHLHNMLIPANIDFELNHSGLNDHEKLNMNFRQNVYLTFKEAINNIVKHSGATKVTVDLKKENSLFIMEIKDDGKGMSETKPGSGQGLYNMKLRADRLRASLQLISENGTTVLLKVPV
ncbi:MAG: two-component regulator propeller domain-containing protein [Chitinophagaceae bacterium]